MFENEEYVKVHKPLLEDLLRERDKLCWMLKWLVRLLEEMKNKKELAG
jgi:hypothetical protein